MRVRGLVEGFNPVKGYGYTQCGDQTLFVHASEFVGDTAHRFKTSGFRWNVVAQELGIRDGMQIEYTPGPPIPGKEARAKGVVVL